MAINSVRLGSTLDSGTVKPSKIETTRPSVASEAKDTPSSVVKTTNTAGALLELPEIQVIPTAPSEPTLLTTKESTETDSIPPEKPDDTSQKTVTPMKTNEEPTQTGFVLSEKPDDTPPKTVVPMETQEEPTQTGFVLSEKPDDTPPKTVAPMETKETPSTETIPQPVQMQQTTLPPVVVPSQANPFAVYPPGTMVVILPQGGNGAALSQTPVTAFDGQGQPMMTQPMYWPSSPQLDPLLDQVRQIGALPIPPAVQPSDVMSGNLWPMSGWSPASPDGGASNLPTWSQGLYSDILNTYFGGSIPPGGADYTAGLRFTRSS